MYHMIDWMRKDMIALTIESNELSISHKEKKDITKWEFEKS